MNILLWSAPDGYYIGEAKLFMDTVVLKLTTINMMSY